MTRRTLTTSAPLASLPIKAEASNPTAITERPEGAVAQAGVVSGAPGMCLQESSEKGVVRLY